MTSFSILDNFGKKSRKIKVMFWILLKILWKMEHLLFWSKCSIFHNIFKYMISQRRQKLLWLRKEFSPMGSPCIKEGGWKLTRISDHFSCLPFYVLKYFSILNMPLVGVYLHRWASSRQNHSLGFPIKWDSNQSPQLQKPARILKFCL